MNVLVLANDMVADAGVSVSLLAAGSRLVQTASVDQALVLIAANHFDAIVVDFRPDLWGHQAISRLRAAQVQVPILFVSARSTEDAVQRAYDVGADDVVVLPVDHGQIAARLAALVQGTVAVVHSHRVPVATMAGKNAVFAGRGSLRAVGYALGPVHAGARQHQAPLSRAA